MKAKINSDRVREILFKRSISQNSLAHKLQISSGYCSQLLSGTRTPSPGLRRKLMRELKADFDTLFESIQAQEDHHVEAA
jgi:transcriptional regulator with XRE-family HTH domain